VSGATLLAAGGIPPPRGRGEHGYVLLPVILALTLVATITFLMSHESAMGSHQVAGEMEVVQAEYVAEAGLAHATWQLQQDNCTGYRPLPPTPFGTAIYAAIVTPASGSPVTIFATGAVAGGTSRTLTREGVRVYPPTTTITVQLSATSGQDTLLDDFSPTRNYGGANPLTINSDPAWIQRPLLQFDLSAIPPGVTILQASLELYFYNVNTGGTATVHRMTRSWVEGTKNGGGIADGATWQTYDSTNPWAAAGGDFDPRPVAATDIPTGTTGWVSWEIGPLVQARADNTAANFGFMLRGDGTLANAGFAGRDDTGATLRPKLTITYGCECGTGPTYALDLQPGKEGEDTFIQEDQPTNVFGTDKELRLKQTTGKNRNALVRFDLSAVPGTAIITSATLELSQKAAGSGAGNVEVHRVTAPWLEQEASWNNAAVGLPWANSGGDYDPAVVDTAAVAAGTDTLVRWDVTTTVAAWVDGSLPNHGLLLTPGAGVTDIKFRSSDETSSRPRLRLTWGCPCSVDCSPTIVSGFYRDQVTHRTCAPTDYSGSDGTLDWTTFAWQEINDDGDPCGWQVGIEEDPVVLDPGNYRLHIQGDGTGIERQVDLAAASLAILTFEYRTEGIFNAARYLSVQVSANGGTTWAEIDRIESGDNALYLSKQYDISAYANANTKIRLLAVGFTASEAIYLDNIEVAVNPVGGEGGDTIVLATAANATLGGVSFTPDDLVEYRPATGTGTILFDGATAFGANKKIDAVAVLADGHIVLSTAGDATLGGLAFKKGDLVEYSPASDTARLFFDGAKIANKEIDAVSVLPDGHIVLSTKDTATLAGLTFNREDLAEYDPATDTATLFFDGSALGMTRDIDAVHVLDNGHLILSTTGDAILGGIAFSRGDLIDYDPATDTAALYFSGVDAFGAPQDISAVNVTEGGTAPRDNAVVFPPTADTYIQEENPTKTKGGDSTFRLSHESAEDRRGLIQFDLSSLAPGTPVAKAVLRLYVDRNETTATATLQAYTLTQEWGEAQATWNDRLTSVAWSTGGGDYATPAVATTVVGARVEHRWLEIDLTAVVQGWVDTPLSNQGLILTSNQDRTIRIFSREAGNAALRPKLSVTLQ